MSTAAVTRTVVQSIMAVLEIQIWPSPRSQQAGDTCSLQCKVCMRSLDGGPAIYRPGNVRPLVSDDVTERTCLELSFVKRNDCMQRNDCNTTVTFANVT